MPSDITLPITSLPSLYKYDAIHNLRVWTVSYTTFHIITACGLNNGEMKVTTNDIRGKRYTAQEEAEAMWKRRIRTGWKSYEEINLPESVLRVMKAHKFSPKYEEYPGFCQPKLDGIRCSVTKEDGIPILKSRGNKEFEHMIHLQKDLAFMPDGWALDGELYVHGEPFENLSSWIRGSNEYNSLVQFHVYDVPVIDGKDNYKHWYRLSKINEVCQKINSASGHDSLVPVETVEVRSNEELMHWHEVFKSQGYEGSMYRDFESSYEFDKRSYSLLKIKDFDDEEFTIVDIIDGKGKFAGHAVFQCMTEEGYMFSCTMNTTAEESKRIYSSREIYRGKRLKVQFQGKSTYGVPRFPRALCIREDE